MRFITVFCFFLVMLTVFGQEDTTEVRELNEIRISAVHQKEIVFKDSKYYILDFYVGDQGTLLLVSHFRKYFLYSLDSAMQIETKMKLDFHPRSLFEDCYGNVHIQSNDSLYHVVKIQKELFFYEVNPISLYYTFLKNCVASTDSAAIIRSYAYGTQNLVYLAYNLYNNTKKGVYCVLDPVVSKSLGESSSLKQTLTGTEKMGEITSSTELNAIRDRMDQVNFFDQVLNKPKYNPLFVVDDTIYMFDHLNDKVVLLKNEDQVITSYPIRYHHSKKWAKEIKVDYKLKQFYSVDQVHGCNNYKLLDLQQNKVTRQVKITDHAFIEKTIFYDGYVFYTFKESEDANLNRLYRQKL